MSGHGETPPAPVTAHAGGGGISQPPGAADPTLSISLDDAWFAPGVCRNCGAALVTPFCGQCGQRKARRFRWRDVGREAWERARLFESGVLRTTWRLVAHPGQVAREYVMGMRQRHVHPLKLLLFAIALLLLVLARNRYFGADALAHGGDAKLERMAALVQGYANWSFSTGILAILVASLLVFRRRLGYNAIEHSVLAVYCQVLVIGVILLNMLPTLVWNTPEFIRAYKAASGVYLYAFKIAIVAIAFQQFYLVSLRREWPRLLLAVAVYVAASWLLLRAYARLILALVEWQHP